MAFVTENILLIILVLVSGALLAWPAISGGLGGVPALGPAAATRLMNDENPIVVDVRSAEEFATGHLANARNIPLPELAGRVDELKGSRPVLLCCASGARSARAAGTLKSAGHETVYNLAGGIQAWSQAGLPTARN